MHASGVENPPRPRKAKILIALDRAAGGRSQYSRTEFRHCEMCARPLVGIDAEKRRRVIEEGPLANASMLPNVLKGPGAEDVEEVGAEL
jgi:hypothetical protein